jgi:hypothetical protein
MMIADRPHSIDSWSWTSFHCRFKAILSLVISWTHLSHLLHVIFVEYKVTTAVELVLRLCDPS